MNLARSLLYAAERAPDAEAVVHGDSRLTYASLRERAARLARGLEERGVGRGDRLAAIARNRHETAELFWACQWLGAVFVPLSHRASREDLDYCAADSGAALVIGADDAERRDVVHRFAHEMATQRVRTRRYPR